jgi:hypothetical protein
LGRLLPLPENIRPGWEGLPGIATLAFTAAKILKTKFLGFVKNILLADFKSALL